MSDKIPSSTHAPMYANAYATLVPIARAHGYALAVHGSMKRDLDLVAIPWVDEVVSEPEALVAAFAAHFYFVGIDGPELKPHGRLVWTLAWPGECFIDLGVMPVKPKG